MLRLRRKSMSEKGHALAASALSTFERAAADLHAAADLMESAASHCTGHADDLMAQIETLGQQVDEFDALATQHTETAAKHRAAAERIASFFIG